MSLRVAVIGVGGLSWSLAPALRAAGIELVGLYGPAGPNAEALSELVSAPHFRWPAALPENTEVIWLAVPDDSLQQVSDDIACQKSSLSPDILLVHSSGATPIEAIAREGFRAAVVYPLASFTRGQVLDLSLYPIFYEADNLIGDTALQLARALSENSQPLGSEQRLVLHVGAVWANNFSNLMLSCAGDLMQRAGLPVDARVYLPLMRGMIDKLELLSPEEAQTGPARRGDHQTLVRHRELVRQLASEIEPLYNSLSDEIERRYRL